MSFMATACGRARVGGVASNGRAWITLLLAGFIVGTWTAVVETWEVQAWPLECFFVVKCASRNASRANCDGVPSWYSNLCFNEIADSFDHSTAPFGSSPARFFQA